MKKNGSFRSGETSRGGVTRASLAARLVATGAGRLRASAVRSALAWTMSAALVAGSAVPSGAQTLIKLLDYDSSVKYNDSDTDFYGTVPSWKERTFDDSNWPQGQQLLAYETDSWALPLIRTLLWPPTAYDPPGHVTYFRVHFSYSSPNPAILTLSNRIDDGAVFYLNGVEIQRIRVGAGEVTHTYLASSTSGEISVDAFTYLAANLVAGDNVLAVSVHQSSTSSSDTVYGTEVWAETMQPIVITTQPVSQTVQTRDTVNFTVAASGTRLHYQWQFNSGPGFVDLSNQTNAILSLNNVQPVQAGPYRVIVSNAVQSVTSAVATLTVVADATPPRLLSAFMQEASAPPYYVLVRFDERLLSGFGLNGGANVSNYRIVRLDDPMQTLTISNALPNADLVRLTVSPWVTGSKYVLYVTNVADVRTNAIAPGSAIGVISPLGDLIPLDQPWNWSDAGVDLGTAWTAPDYNESTNSLWALANPGFFPVTKALFYATFDPLPGPKNTSLALGSPTFYFRTRFVLPPGTASTGLIRFTHMVDDGAVFHLNGHEVFRYNMGSGPVSFDTLAVTEIRTASLLNSGDLLVTNLVSGTNVLAVETHVFSTAAWGDFTMTFGTAVKLATAPDVGASPPPRMAARRGPLGKVVLEWPGSGFGLRSAPTPLGPWSAVPEAASPFTNATTAPQQFFRLEK